MLEGYNQRGSLSLQEAQELGDQMQVEVQLKEEHALGLVSDPAADLRHVRGVVAIKKTGHNVYSCQIVVETTKEDDSKKFQWVLKYIDGNDGVNVAAELVLHSPVCYICVEYVNAFSKI